MMAWREYFEQVYRDDLLRPPLVALKKPCHDCAVVCGLYTEISEALTRESDEVRRVVSSRWFCHNHRDKACRGNLNIQAMTPTLNEVKK
jgi:hypothetical protein